MAKRFISYLNTYEVEMKEKGKATFKSYISDFNGKDEGEDKDEDDYSARQRDSGQYSRITQTTFGTPGPSDGHYFRRSTLEENSQSEEPSPQPRASDNEEVEKTASQFFDKLMEPSLLPGEIVICEAEKALRFQPCSERTQGISGSLFVTNFRVSFVTADKSSYTYKESKSRQRNKLIDDNDIPLTSISTVYQVMSGGKKRALVLDQRDSSASKYLEIHCKDFRVHVFGFKFVPKDQNKRTTDVIAHHWCPTRDNLLFAYEFGLNGKFRENHQLNKFYQRKDWEAELKRLKCDSRWRVADFNQNYDISTTLPEYFVVPDSLKNADLQQVADQYNKRRLPTWCYTYPKNNASLVRMSHFLPDSDFKNLESKMLSAIQLACDQKGHIDIIDLTQKCPSLADIRNSGQRLMALCMTDSTKEFYSHDSTWMSRLDSTQWLQHVASCLKIAGEITDIMMNKVQSIIIREEASYDLTCVVSCLVQLMLDPEYRTQQGFSSLVQREWVVMGHPFQDRHHLVQGPEGEQGPVFLLFLDCVWQLLQQFPSRLGFTETFLTSIWDTAQLGVTDTFLFNSARHRSHYFRQERVPVASLCLPSAWEWNLQLGHEDTLLFNNPLYTLYHSFNFDSVISNARDSLKRAGKSSSASLSNSSGYEHLLTDFYEADKEGRHKDLFTQPTSNVLLPVSTTSACIRLWSQCYLRWCVPCQILGGGHPAGYLQQCLLVEEVIFLDHKLKLLHEQTAQRDAAGKEELPRPHSGLVFSLEAQSQLNSVHLTSSFPFPAHVTAQTQHKLISGPLSRYLHDSLVQYDYANAEDDD